MCKIFNKLLGFSVLLFVSSVQADIYHYNNQLVGERAAGMGGAYTAVSDDPGGLYYNPAGISYTKGNKLSASMNSFSESTTRYKNALASEDWVRSSSGLTPSFFGMLQEFAGGVAGFSYVITDNILTDQDQEFYNLPSGSSILSLYRVNFNESDQTSLIGPSYAFALAESFSVGLSLYYYERNYEQSQTELALFDPSGNYFIFNRYVEVREYGLEPVLGLLWDVSDKLAVGFSFGKKLRISEGYTGQLLKYDEENRAASLADPALELYRANLLTHGQLDYENPYYWRFGLAFFPNAYNLISADFSYHAAIGNRVATWNAALGMETYLTNKLALRAGLFTNNANTPQLVVGRGNQLEHTDFYGVSLSLTTFSRYSSLSLGIVQSSGSGEAQVAGGTAMQQVEATSMKLFVSAGTSY